MDIHILQPMDEAGDIFIPVHGVLSSKNSIALHLLGDPKRTGDNYKWLLFCFICNTQNYVT